MKTIYLQATVQLSLFSYTRMSVCWSGQTTDIQLPSKRHRMINGIGTRVVIVTLPLGLRLRDEARESRPIALAIGYCFTLNLMSTHFTRKC